MVKSRKADLPGHFLGGISSSTDKLIRARTGKKLCRAMIKAGIINADSKEGVEFCMNNCPYSECVI